MMIKVAEPERKTNCEPEAGRAGRTPRVKPSNAGAREKEGTCGTQLFHQDGMAAGLHVNSRETCNKVHCKRLLLFQNNECKCLSEQSPARNKGASSHSLAVLLHRYKTVALCLLVALARKHHKFSTLAA
eukprot:5686068-Amphidinium_carterae.1